MPRHHDSSHLTPSILLVLLAAAALLTQDASAIRWSSPRTGDIISPGDMILAAWEAEKKTDSPILRLCSQGLGDQAADCSVLGDPGFSHRKNGGLASLLLVPESVSAGKSYFQVELEGEVHDSPLFSVLESIRQPDVASNSRPPATVAAQELTATTRIEFVTQTIVTPVPDLSQEIDGSALPALSPALESSSWLPRLPAKPVVRLDSHGPNVVGVVVVIMVVLFALAAVGALVAILGERFKRSRRHDVTSPYCGVSTADDRFTCLPDKKPNAAPTVQYLPNLHSLGIHTMSAGSYSSDANPRMSLDDVRLTPRINPFPSPKDGGGFDKGPTNLADRGAWQWPM